MFGGCKVLLVFLLLAVVIAEEDDFLSWKRAVGRTWIKTTDTSPNCYYQGYAPNGDIKDIGGIETPKASLNVQKGLLNFMNGISKKLGKFTGVAMHAIKFSSQITKNAPYLGPALGVFTAVVGGFFPSTQQSPQEIIDKVNTAVSQLALEVDQKLGKMKGYVDSRVVNLEKELIKRKYSTNFRFWMNCLSEATEGEVNSCQKDALKLVLAQRGEFAIHSDSNGKITKPKKDFYVVRQFEAYLTAFRNWANLAILQLTPLAEAYCFGNRKDMPEARARCEKYAKELRREAEFALEYSKNAIEYIKDGHWGDGTGRCRKTVKCQSPEDYNRSGKYYTGKCSCEIESSNTKTLCTLKYKRYDEVNKDKEDYRFMPVYGEGFDSEKDQWGNDELGDKAFQYQRENKKFIEKYWKENVGIFFPQWEKAVEIAEEMMKKGGITEAPRPVAKCHEGWSAGTPTGDGITEISPANTPDPKWCMNECANKRKWSRGRGPNKYITGVKMRKSGNGCWCVRKMTGVDRENKRFKVCMLKPDKRGDETPAEDVDDAVSDVVDDVIDDEFSPRFKARYAAVVKEMDL